MLTEFQNSIVNRLMAMVQVPLTADGTWTADAGTKVNINQVAIILEDAANLLVQIENAIGQVGMVILVGQASVKNTHQVDTGPAQMSAELQIGLGEVPTVWRMTKGAPNNNPPAKKMADLIVSSLQGMVVAHFKPVVVDDAVYVRDPKRQLYNINVHAKAIVPSTQYR